MTTESRDGRLQALHVLKSYLDSLNIPFSQGVNDTDIVVKSRQGTHDVSVKVTSDSVTPVVSGTHTVSALDVVSPDLERVVAAVHSVTEAAGYGKPDVVNRGAAPTTRINYRDDFELVYLRHALLRRTPTPKDMGVVEACQPIIKKAAQKAMFKFRNVLAPMGFGESDLINIGRIHTLCFLHSYAYDMNQDNNKKLLTEYLNQRFGELSKVTFKKAMNSTCLSQSVKFAAMAAEGDDEITRYMSLMTDEDAVAADEEYSDQTVFLRYPNGQERVLRTVSDGFLGFEAYLDNERITHADVDGIKESITEGRIEVLFKNMDTDEENELNSAAHKRKRKAREELHAQLKNMTPDMREHTLAYAALSRDYSPDARAFARKLCSEMECEKCKKKVIAGIYCACGGVAVPRYGIDYISYRDKLRTNGNNLADAMTAPIPEAEVRAKAAKMPRTKNKTEIPKLSKEEFTALVDKARKECFDALPDYRVCPKCGVNKHKKDFGVRVPRRKSDGMPGKACTMPYCKPCRKVPATR